MNPAIASRIADQLEVAVAMLRRTPVSRVQVEQAQRLVRAEAELLHLLCDENFSRREVDDRRRDT